MNTVQHHQKLIILDFDHTVFNTTRYVEALKTEFNKKFGIDADEFMKQRDAVKQCCVVIDIDRFVHLLPNPNKQEMKDALHRIIRTKSASFIFSDVIPFIERHKDRFDIIVSTHGDQKLQTEKIRHSNLPQEVQSLISTQSKEEVIRPFTEKYSNVYFIDDKAVNIDAVKTALPNVITYFMQRQEDSPYAAASTKCECADHVVKGLDFDID